MGIAGWKSGRDAVGCGLDMAECFQLSWWPGRVSLDTPGLDGGRRYPVTSDSGLIQSGDKSPHSKFGVLRLVGALVLHVAE
jgi:hypothetical protein